MSHHTPDPNKNINLTIDGISVTVPEGTRILEAAKKANIKIPTLCEHPDLCKRALCRICVVECDGRGKLIAACANEVWEGVSVVTNNRRLFEVRKTILELILANHPQDCLTCVRNKKCELQSLAESFALRETPFQKTLENRPKTIESDTIVRDMNKCVKCVRCVEACQEVQTIRAINTTHRSFKFEVSAPYKKALSEGNCVFCGRCAEVCPVGAIYGHDQTEEIWASINDSERQTMAQIPPSFADALNNEFDLAAEPKVAEPKVRESITTGKIISAAKLLGFDKVFDAKISAMICMSEQGSELQRRKDDGGKLPMITMRCAGAAGFVKNFYPDLADHLSTGRNPRQVFAGLIKTKFGSNVTTVTFVPNIALKYNGGAQEKTDFALTAAEFARMIKLAGIDINSLPSAEFDIMKIDSLDQGKPPKPVRKETVNGFANAREVMEDIRKGKCNAQLVEIAG